MTDSGDSYLTAAGRAEIETKVKGSRFVGRVFPVSSKDEAEAQVVELRKRDHDATHHCFAYSLRVGAGQSGATFRFSDDHEPSGSAGKPIYDRLTGLGVTNTLVVVTRYFGGTKLGVGGLVRAYGEAAGLALEKACLIEKFDYDEFALTIDFSAYQGLQGLISRVGGIVIDSQFSENVQVRVNVRRSLADEFSREFIELTHGKWPITRDTHRESDGNASES
ncbi:MAG: YigZ family protein [candidate division Zixibacteria bacterium]|nr:YigZ family protein [candidate division Zixibacteria bacterium]